MPATDDRHQNDDLRAARDLHRHPSSERNLHDQQGIGDEAQSWLEGVGATVHGVNVRKADEA